jgi:RNA polymerase sigma-70 factor, ECF subfamily
VTAEEFDEVYERTARPLRAHLIRLGGNVALADEVVQETYYRFLTMERAKRQAVPDRPLLFRMATHLMYDHFRRVRREQRALLLWPRPRGPSPDPGLDPDLARVFQELKPRERSLLSLAYVEGWSHAEVAEALGLKPASVRVLLFRAKRALAHLIRSRGLAPEVDP